MPIRKQTRLLGLALMLPLAGCGAGLGTLGTLGTVAELLAGSGRPGASPEQVQITAAVQDVDVRRQMIRVETADGRAGAVTFDLGTRVVRGGRAYPLNALGHGDVVNLHLEESAPRSLHAVRIEVVSIADEGAPAAARTLAPAPAAPRDETPAPDTAQAPEPETRPAPAPRDEPRPQPAPAPEEESPGEAVEVITGLATGIDRDRGRFGVRTGDLLQTVHLPAETATAVRARFDRLADGDRIEVDVRRAEGGRLEVVRFR